MLYVSPMASAKKEKTYGRYTKENEKEKLITTKEKSMKHKRKHKRNEEGPKTLPHRQKTIYKGSVSPYSLIIILRTNGLNSPIKRHGVADLMKKMRFHYILSIGDLL